MKKITSFFIGLIVLVITSLSIFYFYEKWIIKCHFEKKMILSTKISSLINS